MAAAWYNFEGDDERLVDPYLSFGVYDTSFGQSFDSDLRSTALTPSGIPNCNPDVLAAIDTSFTSFVGQDGGLSDPLDWVTEDLWQDFCVEDDAPSIEHYPQQPPSLPKLPSTALVATRCPLDFIPESIYENDGEFDVSPQDAMSPEACQQPSCSPTVKPSSASSKRKSKRLFSIAQVEILSFWLQEHMESPYPNPDTIQTLSTQTGLKARQIRNWFSMMRRRKLGEFVETSGGGTVACLPKKERQLLTESSLVTGECKRIPSVSKSSRLSLEVTPAESDGGSASDEEYHNSPNSPVCTSTCHERQKLTSFQTWPSTRLDWWFSTMHPQKQDPIQQPSTEVMDFELTLREATALSTAPSTLDLQSLCGMVDDVSCLSPEPQRTSACLPLTQDLMLSMQTMGPEPDLRQSGRYTSSDNGASAVSRFSMGNTSNRSSRTSYSRMSGIPRTPRKGRRRHYSSGRVASGSISKHKSSVDSDIATAEYLKLLKNMPDKFRSTTLATSCEPDSRPFKCAYCSSTFTRKTSCTRHEKSVHGLAQSVVYICRGFGVLDGMHCMFCSMKEITGACPHRFDVCAHKSEEQRTFFRRDNFRQHLEGVHKVPRSQIELVNLSDWAKQKKGEMNESMVTVEEPESMLLEDMESAAINVGTTHHPPTSLVPTPPAAHDHHRPDDQSTHPAHPTPTPTPTPMFRVSLPDRRESGRYRSSFRSWIK